MVGREQSSHRPGLLKQQNKSHKNGKHRSKSEIDKNNKGIVVLQLSLHQIKIILCFDS